jgi:hypothetical protein
MNCDIHKHLKIISGKEHATLVHQVEGLSGRYFRISTPEQYTMDLYMLASLYYLKREHCTNPQELAK